jgi:hypothetical protein
MSGRFGASVKRMLTPKKPAPQSPRRKKGRADESAEVDKVLSRSQEQHPVTL